MITEFLIAGALSLGPTDVVHDLQPCGIDGSWEGNAATCFWDAQKRGNGEGQDFVILDGEVHYVELTNRTFIDVQGTTYKLDRNEDRG